MKNIAKYMMGAAMMCAASAEPGTGKRQIVFQYPCVGKHEFRNNG